MNESLPSPYRRALRMLDTPDAKALLGAPPLEALQNGDGAAARRSLDATRRWTRYQLWVLMVGAMALGVWVGLMYDAVSLRGWEGAAYVGVGLVALTGYGARVQRLLRTLEVLAQARGVLADEREAPASPTHD